MPILHTLNQRKNATRKVTRPITLIRWEFSGSTEYISLNGEVQFDGHIYQNIPVELSSIKNQDSASMILPPSKENILAANSGAWRKGSCKVYEIPADPNEKRFKFTLDDAILKLDGIIDNAVYSGNKIQVSVVNKYFFGSFTPKYIVNDFSTIVPVAGSFFQVSTDRYQLKSRRNNKLAKMENKRLRGRVSIAETNELSFDDKALDTEMSGDGAAMPLILGKPNVNGMVCANGTDASGNLIFLVVWGHGMIFQVEDIFNNGVLLPSNVIVHTYRGLQCQEIDNYMQSIVGITYTDKWKILADGDYATGSYSVIRYPVGTLTTAPRFQAIIKGIMAYDTRAGSDYFDNMESQKVGFNFRFIGTNGTAPTAGCDLSHNNKNIVWHGNANIQDNKLSLDGDGDYVRMVSHIDVRPETKKWSLEIVCTPAVGSTGEVNAIFGIGNTSNDRCILITQFATALVISMSSTGNTWDLLSSYNIENAAFSGGVKTNILVEYDERGYFFMVNGVQKHYLANATKLYGSTADIYLGAQVDATGTSTFKGTITGARFDKAVNRYTCVHSIASDVVCYADEKDNKAGFGYTNLAGAVGAGIAMNKHYGLGVTEPIRDLINLVKFNESVVGGAPRSTIDLVITEPKPTVQVLDLVFGVYGDSFWFFEGSGMAVRPDKIIDKFNPSGWEMTTNGDFFDDAADWSYGSGWTYLSSIHAFLCFAASTKLEQEFEDYFEAGVQYVVTLSVDERVAGSISVDLDGEVLIESQSASGIYAAEFTADGTESKITATPVSYTGFIGEFSVRRKFWRDFSIVDKSLDVVKLKETDTPNKLIATYKLSSASTPNWPDGVPTVVELPTVTLGLDTVVQTRVRYEGLKSLTKASAKAKTALYRLQERGTVKWKTTDAALFYQIGTVIELHDNITGEIHFALLETFDRYDDGRYICNGSIYSDRQYPIDQVTQTGVIPVNHILPVMPSKSVPTGYSAFATANGKYIKAAGESIAVGTLAGSDTHAGITSTTSEDGEHGVYEEEFDSPGIIQNGGSEDGFIITKGNDNKGKHYHDFSTGVLTPDPYGVELILAKKITSEGTSLPTEIMALGKGNLSYPDMMRFTKRSKRLLRANTVAANIGTERKMLTLTTEPKDDTHIHSTETVTTTGLAGAGATAKHYENENGGFMHSHEAVVELIRNIRRFRMAAYHSGQNYGIGKGMITMYDGALSDLHKDYRLVRDIENCLIEIAAKGEEDKKVGNNALRIRNWTDYSEEHEHKGEESDVDVPVIKKVGHSSKVRHRHEVIVPIDERNVSQKYWEPPSHALYFVEYDPEPEMQFRDLALFVEGGMPNAHSTVVDVGPNFLSPTLIGAGTISYSSAALLFGKTMLKTTGDRRIRYPSLTYGKKFTVRGFFRNDAVGATTYLFSNNNDANPTRTFTVAKDASNNIVLYYGTTPVATVTLGVAANEIYFVALSYDGAKFYLYAGKESTGVANSSTYTLANFDAYPQLGIFGLPEGGFSTFFTFAGYCAQFQVVKGISLYSKSKIKIPKKPFRNWMPCKHLVGQNNWWDEIVTKDGYYTNADPDTGGAALENNSGARACLIRESGLTNATVRAIWPGVHSDGECGLAMCIVPSADEFAIGWNYEEAFGAFVLWTLGRKPSQIGVLNSFVAPHVDGVPMELSATISGTTINCYADGVLLLSHTIPVALQGSTKHGVYVDVNRVKGRPPYVKGLVAPFRIDTLDLPWAFDSGVFDDDDYWIDDGDFI